MKTMQIKTQVMSATAQIKYSIIRKSEKTTPNLVLLLHALYTPILTFPEKNQFCREISNHGSHCPEVHFQVSPS